MTLGDSKKTLPEFIKTFPRVKCDLILIDGGHTDYVPMSDFMNFYKMVDFTRMLNLVFVDDWPSPYEDFVHPIEQMRKAVFEPVAQMWTVATSTGRAHTIRQCKSINPKRGFTIGKFLEV